MESFSSVEELQKAFENLQGRFIVSNPDVQKPLSEYWTQERLYCWSMCLAYHSSLYLLEKDDRMVASLVEKNSNLNVNTIKDLFEEGLESYPCTAIVSGITDIIFSKIKKMLIPLELHSAEIIKIDRNQQGQFYDLDYNHIGRLIITLPSAYTGGDFVVSNGDSKDTISLANYSKSCNWVLCFGNMESCRPVTSGTQIFIEALVKFARPIYSPPRLLDVLPDNILKGYMSPSLRKWYIRKMVIDEHSSDNERDSFPPRQVGILLSNEYSRKKEFSVEMLEGSIKDLAEELKKNGFMLKLKPMLCYTDPKSGANMVATMSAQEKSITEMCSFFALDPNVRVECVQWLKSSSLDIGPQFHGIRPVLVVNFPSAWNIQRLLWLGNKKNTAEDCILATLPTPLVKYLCHLCKTAFWSSYEYDDEFHNLRSA